MKRFIALSNEHKCPSVPCLVGWLGGWLFGQSNCHLFQKVTFLRSYRSTC